MLCRVGDAVKVIHWYSNKELSPNRSMRFEFLQPHKSRGRHLTTKIEDKLPGKPVVAINATDERSHLTVRIEAEITGRSISTGEFQGEICFHGYVTELFYLTNMLPLLTQKMKEK